MKDMIKSILCALLVIGAVSAAEFVKTTGVRGLKKSSDSGIATGRKLEKSNKGKARGGGNDRNGGSNFSGVYDRAFFEGDAVNANSSPDLCYKEPSRVPASDECTSQLSPEGVCPAGYECCGSAQVCVGYSWYVCDSTGSSASFGHLRVLCQGLPEKVPIDLGMGGTTNSTGNP